MVFVEVCVGSSCFLKGSEEVISKMQKAIEAHRLEDEIILSGSFCTGECNRIGVTIRVDDDVFPGIRPESFDAFFEETIVGRIRAGEGC